MPPTAANIAADLAIAMFHGYIRPDEQLPSQSHLCRSYGVSTATANAALAKLAAAGLSYVIQGRGTYATNLYDDLLHRPPAIVTLLTAARICRSVASSTWPQPDIATVPVGGSRYWGTPDYDEERHLPPRFVSVAALIGLDRHVVRWMSEQFVLAARRLVGAGGELADTDQHLIQAAESIVTDGGHRPDKQPAIGYNGGPRSAEEDVVLRIWPERGLPVDPDDPDAPPF